MLDFFLDAAPAEISPATLVQVLWTLSAMSQHPRRTFERSAALLAVRASELDAAERESAQWCLNRAGVGVPSPLLPTSEP